MRSSPRRSVANLLGLVTAAGLAGVLWLGVAPASAQVPTVPGKECEGIPNCRVHHVTSFTLSGWDTLTYDFICRNPYPYAWSFSYTQTGHPSVSNIATSSSDYPNIITITFTNWNPFQTDDVFVTLGCSKDNKFAGDCGSGIANPNCPQVSGSEKDFCRNAGFGPVCVQTYEERCANGQLYRCTIVDPFPAIDNWCQPCPG